MQKSASASPVSIAENEHYRQLVEAISEYAIYILDPRGLVSSWNAGAQRLKGYQAAEIVGEHFSRFYTAEDRAAGLPGRALETANHVGRFEDEGWRLRKDGTPFWAHIVLQVIRDPTGSLVGYAKITRDIGDRSRLHAQLRQAQKMEVVGRLAAGVAHDFNNILQVIIGATDLLRNETPLESTAEQFLNLMENAARRGAYLTHYLLSYSRKQVLTPKLLDLAKTVENLRSVLSRTLESNIEVSIATAPSVGQLLIDSAQLETALINLAINASQAMPGGGTLRIQIDSAAAAPFGDLKPGRYVVFAVTDTGAGMSPEVLENAFDPFFTTKGVDGTGLGLAMVQGFARQSGGDVRATSTLGQGARFEIWLPQIPAAKPVVGVAPVAKPIRAGHVLLVDDSRDVLLTVQTMLLKGGFTIESAFQPRDALALIAAGRRFDLLLTDYMMPELNGVALLRECRKFQPDLRALIISGYADATNFMADLPNAAFLSKPFDRRTLVARVGEMIADDWDPIAG